jgi:hypothetical protein
VSIEVLQVDDASIVVEIFTAVSRYLHGNTVGIFDVLLTEFLEYAAETVVPALLFLGRFAWVRCAELDE